MGVRRRAPYGTTLLAGAAVALAGAAPSTAASQHPGEARTATAGVNVVSAAEPGACPYAGTHPVLRPGSTDPALRHLHCLLVLQGFQPPPYDGVFGTRTAQTVAAFQRAHGLPGTGVVTAETWEALHEPSV